MSFLTVDMKKLRESWMKLYLNLMSLKSHDPAVARLLGEYTMKFAEMNETMMKFFEVILGE
jgi:hypothetical protein